MAFVPDFVTVAVVVAGKSGDGAETDGCSDSECEERGLHGGAPC
jgi:hypothetical protein